MTLFLLYSSTERNLGDMSRFGFKSKSRATIAASAKAPSGKLIIYDLITCDVHVSSCSTHTGSGSLTSASCVGKA